MNVRSLLIVASVQLLLQLPSMSPCKAQRSTENRRFVNSSKLSGIYSQRFCGRTCLSTLQDFVSLFLNWDLNCVMKRDSTCKSGNAWHVHWTAPVAPKDIRNFKVFHQLKATANRIGQGDYHLIESFAFLLRFGDEPSFLQGTHKDVNDVLMVLQISNKVINGSRSKVVFYNNTCDTMEVLQLHQGRLIAWVNTLNFTIRPPISGSFHADKLLFFRFRPGKEENGKVEEESLTKQSDRKFFLADMPEQVKAMYDVPKHLTRKFHDRFGNIIAIFDGLFSHVDLLAIRKAVLRKGAFSFAEHQADESDDSDNVSWVSGFEETSLLSTKVWKVVKELAEYVSGHGRWYPYDVANNSIERTSHTRIHEDCEGLEYEYTFLLYLNPHWTENMYGETVFFEKPIDKNGIYETITAVKPKFGRVCIFRNSISHSARPPSPDFNGVRFTLAVKVASTKKISLAKILREALEDDDFDNLIKEKVHGATIEGKELDMTEAQLEDLIGKVKKKQRMEHIAMRENVLRKLQAV